MNKPDNLYWIWFQLLFGIGTRRAELLMNYFENPYEIYSGIEEKNRVVGMLTADELKASGTAFTRAGEIKRRTLAKAVDIVTPDDEVYPGLLRQIYSKPAVLYVKGDLNCLNGKLAIAMVGSRKHTEYGKEAAAWIAKGLVKGGAVVVSGLAHGIDTECHMTALMAGGKSIGVLGCGIDVDYPKGNAKTKTIMSKNGAVVTEFPLGTEPRPGNFPIRNRIVSGMCHGVVVIEADIDSGSLLTAHHALEQGRDIFAVPGSIFSKRERGTHRLIRDGAKLTDSAQDIFDEYEYLGFWKNVSETYNQDDDGATSYSRNAPMKDDSGENRLQTKTEPDKQPQRQEVPEEVGAETQAVYKVIGLDAMTVEQIAGAVDVEMAGILSALTELEIYGLIQGYPGRKFGIIPAKDS